MPYILLSLITLIFLPSMAFAVDSGFIGPIKEVVVETPILGGFISSLFNLPFLAPYEGIVTSLIAFAAALSAFLPQGKKGGLLNTIRKFLINPVALNVVNAKNKDKNI